MTKMFAKVGKNGSCYILLYYIVNDHTDDMEVTKH